MLLNAYKLIVRTLAPFLGLLLWVRALRGHEETAHLKERRGVASLPRPKGKLVWIHAASVGEMRSILPLAQHLLNKNPDLYCLITTVTVTAARLLRRTEHQRLIHQYAPFDHPGWIANFLDYWNPDAVLWVESELWPTTLESIKARKLPLVMINGRISERSVKRWKNLPSLAATVLGYFDLCLAQSGDDAKRLESLGAKRVVVAGNMKYASTPLRYDTAALDALRAQVGSRPVLLFASTHAGEEEIAVNIYRTLALKHAGLLVVIMPRHPKRGGDIASILEKEGMAYARRSKGTAITDDKPFYIADTLGEPGLFYRLCPVVYLGNSLISSPGGGHNPIEPAQLGCGIVYGANMWNFAEIDVDLRLAGGALTVRDEKNLSLSLDKLLREPETLKNLGDAARKFVEAQNGVLENVCTLLRPYLERAKIGA